MKKSKHDHFVMHDATPCGIRRKTVVTCGRAETRTETHAWNNLMRLLSAYCIMNQEEKEAEIFVTSHLDERKKRVPLQPIFRLMEGQTDRHTYTQTDRQTE